MASNLDDLLVRIDASTELLRRELNKGVASVNKFEQNVDKQLTKVDQRFKKLGAGLRSVFAGFGLGLGVAGVTRFTQQAIAAGAAIEDAANNAGIAPERLQRLQYAFEQNGVATREFDLSMQRLNRRLGLFITTGGGPAAAAIKNLGLAQDITSGKIKTSEQLFDAVVQRMQGVKTAAERAALASQMFGDDAGPKLVAGLSLGAQGLKEFEDAAKGVLSNEQVAKAAELDDIFQRMSHTVGGNLRAAFVDASHALAEFFAITEEGNAKKRIGELRDEIERLQRDIENGTRTMTDTQFGGAFGFEAQEFGMRTATEGSTVAADEDQITAARTRLTEATAELADIEARLEGIRSGAAATPSAAGIEFPIRDITGPKEERDGFPTVFAGPNLFPSREEYDRVREQLAALEEQALRSQGRMAEAIRMAADEQIRQWRKVAEETPAFAEQAAAAIELINAKAAIDIAALGDEVSDQARELGLTFTSAFESAVVGGEKLRDVLQGLYKDLLQLFVRRQVTEPFLNFFSGIFSPQPRAAGGPVEAHSAYIVGEQGRELFMPNVPGKIINAAQTARMSAGGGGGGGGDITINQHNQVGLPPQWEAQLAAVAQIAAATALQAIEKQFAGRR